MKKITMILLLSAFGVCTLQAQENDPFKENNNLGKRWSFGAQGGLQHNQFRGEDAGDQTAGTISLFLGGLAEYKLSDRFSLQGEALYSRQIFDFSKSGTENGLSFNTRGNSEVDYINVPILAKYYLKRGWSLEAGPQLSYKIRESETSITSFENGTINRSLGGVDRFNDINLSLSLGTTYEFNNGIFLSGRYNKGLSNDSNNSDLKISNDTFRLSVGYKF